MADRGDDVATSIEESGSLYLVAVYEAPRSTEEFFSLNVRFSLSADFECVLSYQEDAKHTKSEINGNLEIIASTYFFKVQQLHLKNLIEDVESWYPSSVHLIHVMSEKLKSVYSS
jgi:hypothetical protein